MTFPKTLDKALSDVSLKDNTLQGLVSDDVLKGASALVASAALDPTGISPVVGLAGLVFSGCKSLVKERENMLFELLDKNPNMITADMIKKSDFLHKALITCKVVVMTNKIEKIVYLANLLKSSAIEKNKIDVDEYEEYLSIVADLSYRELQILSIIDKHYSLDRMPSEPIDDIMNKFKAEWATRFYSKVRNDIQEKLGVRSEELDDVLIRISRSGLYKQIDYITGDNGNGTLTPLFFRIKELIQL